MKRPRPALEAAAKKHDHDELSDFEEDLRALAHSARHEAAAAAGASSDEDAGSDAPPAKRARMGTGTYNAAGLQQALDDIKQDLPWVERLEVVSAEPLGELDVNDDLKMELAFYGQALAAVTAARSEFERTGVPHRRPDDFLAEMMKSDDHMAKVKARLLLENKKIAAVEARKKDKEAGLYAKQVAASRAQSRAADKRAQLDALKQWRKNKGAGRPDLSTDKDLDKVLMARRDKGGADRGGDREGGKGRRAAKDRRYGHGGMKRGAKDNTAGSSRSLKDFNPSKNKALPPGVKGKFGGGGGGGHKPFRNAGAHRPGKAARAASRGKRRA